MCIYFPAALFGSGNDFIMTFHSFKLFHAIITFL